MSDLTSKKDKSEDLRTVTGPVNWPLPKAHFRVFIDRQEVGFLSIGPLHLLTEGTADTELQQTVTLRRAASQDRLLYYWYCDANKAKPTHRELSVLQLDSADGSVVNIWSLDRATPVRWSGPGFDALSNEFAMEELEVRYASITWLDSL